MTCLPAIMTDIPVQVWLLALHCVHAVGRGTGGPQEGYGTLAVSATDQASCRDRGVTVCPKGS